MDRITKIFQRPKVESLTGEADFSWAKPAPQEGLGALVRTSDADSSSAFEALEINRPSMTFLRSQRVIAFDNTHWMTRYYDMLRNLLRDTQETQPHVIAVTSPTAGCGTTVSAINLGLSFARMPSSNVLLVDANVRDPAMGRLLGLPFYSRRRPGGDTAAGMLTTLEFGNIRMHFLRPAWDDVKMTPTAAIQRFKMQIEHARQCLRPTAIIFDVSPMLETDETIPLVLEADSVVVVLATGGTKLSDIEVCQSLLSSKKNVQFVLNKSGKHGL